MPVQVKQCLQLPLSFNKQKEKVKLPLRDSLITFQPITAEGCCPDGNWLPLALKSPNSKKGETSSSFLPHLSLYGEQQLQVTMVCKGIPPLLFLSQFLEPLPFYFFLLELWISHCGWEIFNIYIYCMDASLLHFFFPLKHQITIVWSGLKGKGHFLEHPS